MKGKQKNQLMLQLSFGGSLIGTLVGYYLSYGDFFGKCKEASLFCYFLFSRVGNPLMYGMGALAIVFLFLLIVPQAFEKWKKFAVWFVPIAALFFVFYTDPKGMDMFSPYAEQVYRWLALTYIAISLAIIGTVKFKG